MDNNASTPGVSSQSSESISRASRTDVLSANGSEVFSVVPPAAWRGGTVHSCLLSVSNSSSESDLPSQRRGKLHC